MRRATDGSLPAESPYTRDLAVLRGRALRHRPRAREYLVAHRIRRRWLHDRLARTRRRADPAADPRDAGRNDARAFWLLAAGASRQ